MRSDEELIKSILDGNQTNYRELVSRYQQRVYSVALKITHQQKDAEDIAQEVFIQAYRSLDTFQFDSSFSTWLYRITVNKGLDWKRKNKKNFQVSSFEGKEGETKDRHIIPEEAILRKDQQHSVQFAMKCLPQAYQAVIQLYYFDNLSYQEIADQLGVAKKTVESRLYRAKAMMKDQLVKEGVE